MASQALSEEENLGIPNTVGHGHCNEGIEAQGRPGLERREMSWVHRP